MHFLDQTIANVVDHLRNCPQVLYLDPATGEVRWHGAGWSVQCPAMFDEVVEDVLLLAETQAQVGALAGSPTAARLREVLAAVCDADGLASLRLRGSGDGDVVVEAVRPDGRVLRIAHGTEASGLLTRAAAALSPAVRPTQPTGLDAGPSRGRGAGDTHRREPLVTREPSDHAA